LRSTCGGWGSRGGFGELLKLKYSNTRVPHWSCRYDMTFGPTWAHLKLVEGLAAKLRLSSSL